MYLKIFLKFIFVAALCILQVAFVSGLPFWFTELNIILVFLAFSLEFSTDYKTIWWFFLIGYIFDLYFPLFFGLFIILWPLAYLFALWLSRSFFTNRSLYSYLGLVFFSTIFYYFFLNLFVFFQGLFSGRSPIFFVMLENFWIRLGTGLVLNLIAVFVVFYISNLLSNRLKPVFIIKGT